VLSIVVLVAVVVAAGCGGSEESPQAKWAREFCGALSDWKDSLTTIGTDFGGGISKEVVSQKLDDAEQATNDLVDELKQIGAPETESGDEAKAELDQFAEDAQSSVSTVRDQAQSLADASATEFLAGVSAIAREISTLLDSARSTLEQVQELDPQGELSDAIQDYDTCQSLTQT
jgi:gas vesicle protein